MKGFKIWLLGNLILQGVLWAYMLIMSTVEPAAGWLVFISIFFFIISLIQLPLTLFSYQILKDSLKVWLWWHSLLLWLGSFFLPVILYFLFMIGQIQALIFFTIPAKRTESRRFFLILMSKMSNACEDHCNPMIVGSVDRFLVAD